MSAQVQKLLLAAGIGCQLGEHIDNRPKVIVGVIGRPITQRALDSLAEIGSGGI